MNKKPAPVLSGTEISLISSADSWKNRRVCRLLIALLLSVGAVWPLAAAETDAGGVALLAGPPAGIECAGGEIDVLEPGVKLFLNRDYPAKDVAQVLRGCKFIRNNLEAIHAVCRKPGVVYVVTPSPGGGSPDSLASALLGLGFEKVNLPGFSLLRGGLCSVYQKQMVADESLDLRKWGVLVMPRAE